MEKLFSSLSPLFWVNFSPDLLRGQRIAVFGENVHMLYVAEMTRNSGLLL
jgi:hypothetical protein